ncbi:MAG: cell division protein FtsZ [Nonlabens sp.]
MSHEEFNSIAFDLPKNQSNVIKVIGVGGGGSNAIKHMFQQGIKGVDFVICNTDAQALENSPVPNKVQLGVTLTEGLGAGANPEVGERAARESIEDVRNLLDTNTKMVFITAGMGGGTGTGAAPVIAEIAREMEILTVGIVTTPFHFEGKARNDQAQIGIEKFRSQVDSLIIINNNKLRDVYGNLGFKAGFSKADEVLATASKGIAEVITNHYVQNIDLRDAKTVLSNSGTAIMGSSQASGASRAQEGILKALDSPLLNDNKITGAKNVLLLIVSGSDEITIDEIGEINEHIQNEAGGSANIIMGVGEDETLGDSIAITVIATGFDVEQQNEISNTESKRIIHTLEEEQRATQVLQTTTDSRIVPGKLIMDLEDDNELEDVSAFAKAVTPSKQEPTLREEDNLIVHDLSLEEEEDPSISIFPSITSQEQESTEEPEVKIIDDSRDYPPAPDHLLSLGEFVEDNKLNDPYLLTFDIPESEAELEPGSENIVEDVEDEMNFSLDTTVESPVQAPSIFQELDQQHPSRETMNTHVVEVKDEVPAPAPAANAQEFKIITKSQVSLPLPATPVEDIDPTELPINETLARRAEERKQRMHRYNYKFKNTQRLDDMEKKPAYLRHGVELDDLPSENNRSRTSLNTDGNNQIKFKSGNNSFLHDNVD